MTCKRDINVELVISETNTHGVLPLRNFSSFSEVPNIRSLASAYSISLYNLKEKFLPKSEKNFDWISEAN